MEPKRLLAIIGSTVIAIGAGGIAAGALNGVGGGSTPPAAVAEVTGATGETGETGVDPTTTSAPEVPEVTDSTVPSDTTVPHVEDEQGDAGHVDGDVEESDATEADHESDDDAAEIGRASCRERV